MLTLHPDTLAALKGDHLRALLVHLETTPTPVYLTNFAVDIEYNGNTYLANGKLLNIGSFSHTIDIRVNTNNLVFDAVEPSLVSIFRNNPQSGRQVNIAVAILNSDYSIAGEPIVKPSMTLDGAPKITNDPIKGTATIEQKMVSDFANWKQKAGRRTTPASQHRFFPNDTGFKFAAESGKEIPWGRKS